MFILRCPICPSFLPLHSTWLMCAAWPAIHWTVPVLSSRSAAIMMVSASKGWHFPGVWAKCGSSLWKFHPKSSIFNCNILFYHLTNALVNTVARFPFFVFNAHMLASCMIGCFFFKTGQFGWIPFCARVRMLALSSRRAACIEPSSQLPLTCEQAIGWRPRLHRPFSFGGRRIAPCTICDVSIWSHIKQSFIEITQPQMIFLPHNSSQKRFGKVAWNARDPASDPRKISEQLLRHCHY